MISVIRCFLLWLGEHQTGILATIALHLLIISIVLILKIRTTAVQEYSIMVELPLINDIQEEKFPNVAQQLNAQNMQQDYAVRNIPVNTADNRAVENIQQMVRDIKIEENIAEHSLRQDAPEVAAYEENITFENEAHLHRDKYPDDDTGNNTVYSGATTVSYELSGRHHTWMPAPVYKCRTGGIITVDIVVNSAGYVLTAEINKSRSNSDDPCIVDAAKHDAERSRFSASPLAKQQGSITYTFQAQ